MFINYLLQIGKQRRQSLDFIKYHFEAILCKKAPWILTGSVGGIQIFKADVAIVRKGIAGEGGLARLPGACYQDHWKLGSNFSEIRFAGAVNHTGIVERFVKLSIELTKLWFPTKRRSLSSMPVWLWPSRTSMKPTPAGTWNTKFLPLLGPQPESSAYTSLFSLLVAALIEVWDVSTAVSMRVLVMSGVSPKMLTCV